MINVKQINQNELSYEDYLGCITKDLDAAGKVNEVSRQNILFKSKHQGFGCSESQRQAILRMPHKYAQGAKLSSLAPLFEQIKTLNAGLFGGIITFSSQNKDPQSQLIIIDTKNNTYFIANYHENSFNIGRLNSLINQNIVGNQYIIVWYNQLDPKYKIVFDPVIKSLQLDNIILPKTLYDLAGRGGQGELLNKPLQITNTQQNNNLQIQSPPNANQPIISEIPGTSQSSGDNTREMREKQSLERKQKRQQDNISIIDSITDYLFKKKPILKNVYNSEEGLKKFVQDNYQTIYSVFRVITYNDQIDKNYVAHYFDLPDDTNYLQYYKTQNYVELKKAIEDIFNVPYTESYRSSPDNRKKYIKKWLQKLGEIMLTIKNATSVEDLADIYTSLISEYGKPVTDNIFTKLGNSTIPNIMDKNPIPRTKDRIINKNF